MRGEDWMSNFGDKSLHDLCIPGTHDSFAYDFKLWGPNDNNMPKICNLFIYLWAKCQSKTILEQLLLGIRYIDIRITKYEGQFHTIHSLISIDLDTLLHDVLLFIEMCPTEKIILDFNHLYLSDEEREELETYLNTKLKGHMVRGDYNNIFKAIGEIKEELFVFFRNGGEFMFGQNNINSFWHDTNDVEELTALMRREPESGNLRICQAILTPVQQDVILGIVLFLIFPASLRIMTKRKKDEIYEYLEDDISSKNIVITDFADERYVEICLRENIRRKQKIIN